MLFVTRHSLHMSLIRYNTRCYFNVHSIADNALTLLVGRQEGHPQWCIARNGGGYTQTGLGKGPEGNLLIYDR